MKHRGEIVERAVRESGYSITRLAKRLGKSRRWMYHAFENRNLSLELIISIGSIIHHDFSSSIEGLSRYKITEQSAVNHPVNIGRNEEVELWKDKYLELLEKHNNLLLEIAKKNLLKGQNSGLIPSPNRPQKNLKVKPRRNKI